MAELMELEVATPERLLVREDVADVQVPASNGYLGILPGHAPLLGRLGTGFLSYAAGGRRRYMAIQGGFLEVLPDHIRVLADLAERAEEIDVDRAKADLQQATGQVMHPDPHADPAVALEKAALAQARIDAGQKK